MLLTNASPREAEFARQAISALQHTQALSLKTQPL
jgi:hypothetical protein